MVKPCPCKNRRCTCTVEGASGLTFTGNGSARLPYRPTWEMWVLRGVDTDQADVTVTGDGTSADPWVVSVVTLGGSTVTTIFEADGTWVKPSAGTVAQVIVIGGGGGGGTAADPDADAGGSGGSGGAMSTAWFPFTDLPDDVDVGVGAGGQGGRPISGETTAKSGGRSFFGPYLYAGGGKGGKSQASASQTQSTTVGGTPPSGGPGGAGAVRDGGSWIDAKEHGTYLSPTGGGLGQGTLIPNTNGGGLDIGTGAWAGKGGDGGDAGSDGGDGGDYGGGGGGGGHSTVGDLLFNGGDGAPGVVVVTVW